MWYPRLSEMQTKTSTTWSNVFLYARLQTGTYYGMVMSVLPFISPSVILSIRPGLCLSVTVFSTFLLHALTYWAEILHVPFFLWTFNQVRVSSISVNVCWSYAPFENLNTGNTQFSAFFSYILWHSGPQFGIWLFFTVLQIKFKFRQFASIFVELWPFWNCPFDISVGIGAFVIGLGQISSFLKNTQFFALFSDMPLHIELKICIRFCLT